MSLTPFSAPLSCAPFPAGPGSRSPALSPPSSRPPGAEAPANREVPPFPPVRVRGGRYRLSPMGGRARGRRRALAAGLAVTAVALVAAGPRIGDPVRGHPSEGSGAGASARAQSAMRAPAPSARAARKVSAPVRIADAAAVRLLRPGDRVDVIAAEQTARGATARVVARGALVTKVPEPLDARSGGPGPGGDAGALVVLSVPRSTAARLAGASAAARLSVTLW
ncbi:RcpC/CpaB family pilus assembly protein [Streptomyces sp. B21-106]|uniref:RcpC/CpaB family pilus assembly protein n=1 Tax=unclassified Streptomyces TaxID=2593676 RepID=UPI003FA74FB8